MSNKNQYQPIRATFPKEETPKKMEIEVQGKKYFYLESDRKKLDDFVSKLHIDGYFGKTL